MATIPPELFAVIQSLKQQGLEIDENDPEQAMRILRAILMGHREPPKMLPPEECVEGSDTPIREAPPRSTKHYVLQTPLYAPFPEHTETVLLGMGCFWCSENLFAEGIPGVYSTQVGYSQGVTKNPTYQQVCSGKTNHNEVVRVVYDPSEVSGLFHKGFAEILRIFWENHDPTRPNQQGNDQGTQYRSGIYYTTEAQRELAIASRTAYTEALKQKGVTREICTEIEPAEEFYMAEDYHQQYDKKPAANGYCGLAPLDVQLPALPS